MTGTRQKTQSSLNEQEHFKIVLTLFANGISPGYFQCLQEQEHALSTGTA